MTRAQKTAYRIRWLLLIVAVTSLMAGLWWAVGAPFLDEVGVVGTPGTFLPLDLGSDREIPVNGAIFFGVWLLMQWLFLRPRRGWSFRVTTVSRPLRSSVIAAAFMSMLLTTGLVLTLVEVSPLDFRGVAVELIPDFAICWGMMAALWLGWAVVFWRYWREGDRYTWMGRITRGLVAGSVLELFVATAVFAWNPRNEDCYCSRGSFTGLVFGGAALLWTFGPGLVLVFMHERYRRCKLSPTCSNCGYNLTGNVSGVCPECGTELE